MKNRTYQFEKDCYYCEPYVIEGYRVIAEEPGDQRRWSQLNLYILEDINDGSHWGVYYDEGLTENQDSDMLWLDYKERTVELFPVEKVQVVVDKWVKV